MIVRGKYNKEWKILIEFLPIRPEETIRMSDYLTRAMDAGLLHKHEALAMYHELVECNK